MNIFTTMEDYVNYGLIAPQKAQFMSTGSPLDDIITPGASTVAKFEAVTFLEISHVSECQLNHALSKRLYMSWTIPTQCRLIVWFTVLSV